MENTAEIINNVDTVKKKAKTVVLYFTNCWWTLSCAISTCINNACFVYDGSTL
ncbi:hypothetical protein GBAR_LOCUS17384 [Geodia barretti]|uniref:Uncharacterized protein n=1 Tax=Geodia barretti TaxID=519541 RepID=A0AA35WXV2_GEOBA|nr:hypothetical protein GBAR_LOCUS17384 [Geodia barretti]